MHVAGTGSSSYDEDARALLQQRVAVFWKATFFLTLIGDIADLSTPLESWASIPSLLERGVTLVVLGLWLSCRRGRRSVRFVRTVEITGLVVTAWGISLMGRFMVPVVAGKMFPGEGWAALGSQPAGAAAHALVAVDAFVAAMMLLGGCVVYALRAAVIPSSPRRTLLVTVLCGLPFPLVPVVLMPTGPATIAWRFGTMRLAGVLVYFVWWAIVVAGCTIISSVIYGLRKQVRKVEQLGQYALERKLGEGGMGTVYRAQHALMRRPTAVKLLSAERAGEQAVERFAREVRLTAQLSHPNTITIYDYGRTSDGVFYYAMELLEGATLEAVVDIDGPQPPGRVARVLTMACGALAEAHGVGLIHRDIKPANIMLCERGGEPDVVKVLDFGLVKQLEVDGDQALTAAGRLTGTPLYIAPESLRAPAEVDTRADIYALGAVGYYLLTGQHVFDGQTIMEVCGHHLHTRPVAPSERLGRPLPAQLEALLLRCLRKDPSERPQTALALRDAVLASGAGPWTSAQARAWWTAKGSALGQQAEREAMALSDTVAVDLGERLQARGVAQGDAVGRVRPNTR